MDGASVKAMMEVAARAIIDNVDILSEADRATGDGDHGVGMRRGFEAVLEALADLQSPTPELVMKASGTAIMAKGGGASGAIFGTLFRAGSKALEGKDELDAAGFAAFLHAAAEAVQKRGGASRGQKTMIDSLVPAAQASGTARTLAQSMAKAALAASHGVEATRNMIATTGKARSLGERSLGHLDPGALSVSIILKAMSGYCSKT
jgi:phosphoenolpyruvate---glycerone phosphotransferase subunit DhaL